MKAVSLKVIKNPKGALGVAVIIAVLFWYLFLSKDCGDHATAAMTAKHEATNGTATDEELQTAYANTLLECTEHYENY